ncbi:MAG: hypothetical protein U0414_13690 [Polyangiaceae bacterium]
MRPLSVRRLASLASIVCFGASCAPAPPPAPHPLGPPSPSASAAPSPTTSAAPSAAPSASASAAPPARPTLAVSASLGLTPLFEEPVDFFITGEAGRLGVIARENEQAVPYRLQKGTWEKLALPKPVAASALHAGIYFGRDNLPRLMGWRDDGAIALVYLQFKAQWEDAKKEIGGMAKLPATPLFGVLGEADPEAVCRLDDTCLMKRRSGWKQVPSALPSSAIVRAFNGDGYALYEAGLFRQEEKGFVPVGPAAPWKAPHGFWIGPAGEAIVAADASLHVLEKGATEWRTEPLATTESRDVVGPIDAATVVVATGVIHRGASGFERVGADDRDLDRVIAVGDAIYVAGESGVFAIEKK